jgi:serine phosphatase RsbU (regulator of sigma subunit)/anti-sigma regulatory factor (Ser/Thr protein kinase)
VRRAAETVLAQEHAAVPAARRFAAAALGDLPRTVVEDTELVVTELVTNAVLHGGAPVVLRVGPTPTGVRVEVQDSGREMPLVPVPTVDSMTGRGLSLVAALASSWGIEPAAAGGKVVWAEVDGDASGDLLPAGAPQVDLEALLAAWQDDEPREPVHIVRLGAVPTDLLLAAKSHVDNLVREFTLVQSTSALHPPPHLATLIETVTRDFAAARAEIKRQAVQAAERGDIETELVLTQPASAAAAGERYLAALDEVDRYARSARLLTLETPPAHRIFRRWYVQSLVDQLRARARGEVPPRPATLLQVLTTEVSGLSALHEAWKRLQILQKVTAELTSAHSVDAIARTVADNASEQLGALSVRVYLLGDDDVLRSIATAGASGGGWLTEYDEVPLDADLPGPVVVRTGRPMLLRNRAMLAEQFPVLADVFATERALHVAPLTIGEHRLGALSLAFPVGGELDETTQVAFVRALADALAQALERALAIASAAEANERLAFLAEASVALSGSLDYQETLDAVGGLLVPRLADWCAVQVMERGSLSTLALVHADPDKVTRMSQLAARYPARLDNETGAANVLRTGRSELYSTLSTELLALATVDEEHLQIISELGMASALVVPLTGRTSTFGAITLIYAESGRRYDERDVPFAEDVARRAALAVENAHTYREQSGRLADVTRVAEAAQHAILAPPPGLLGPVALSARYVSAAAEALIGGDLYEVVRRDGAVRLLIGDVRGKGLAAVRTATVVLGEFRAAASDIDDLAELARQLDRRLRPYLGDEDFVTALVAEVRDDGGFALASCGHPPALLATPHGVTALTPTPTLPLGLGADPQLLTGQLAAGDRLLLYTDGAAEARAAGSDRFVDLVGLVARASRAPFDEMLDDLLAVLHDAVGHDLDDDLALVVAEYRPTAAG